MIIGITFFIFLFLGLFIFWGGVKLYGKRYELLYRKSAMIKDEISANDELLKQKVKMEKSVASLTNEDKLLSARVSQKKAYLEQLERDVASTEDQGTAAEMKIELDDLRTRRDTTSKELRDLKVNFDERESALKTLDDSFAKEKMIREESLKAEMVEIRKNMNNEVNEDLARYKELRISETKSTVDTAKISAVRTIKDWWSTEKKRLDRLFIEDFDKMKDEYRVKLKDQVAAEVNEMRDEYQKDNEK